MTRMDHKDFREDFSSEIPRSLAAGTPVSGAPEHLESGLPPLPAARSPIRKRKALFAAAGMAGLAAACLIFFVSRAWDPASPGPVRDAPVSQPSQPPRPAPPAPSAQAVVSDPASPGASAVAEESEKSAEASPPPESEEEAGAIQIGYSYQDSSGNKVSIDAYALEEDGYYAFFNLNSTPLTSAAYAGIGSVSQPELLIFNSSDGRAAGIITGMYAANGQVYYGVLSLDPLEWIVPCMYEDIYLENGRYIGDIPMGSSQALDATLGISRTESSIDEPEEQPEA